MKELFKQFESVIVFWNDAHSNDDEYDLDDIEHRPAPCATIGFVIKDDADGITLAAELGETPYAGAQTRLRNPWFVPRGCITEVIRLKAAKRG